MRPTEWPLSSLGEEAIEHKARAINDCGITVCFIINVQAILDFSGIRPVYLPAFHGH